MKKMIWQRNGNSTLRNCMVEEVMSQKNGMMRMRKRQIMKRGDDFILRGEFELAMKSLYDGKAPGIDKLSSEVFW